jgi:hypothetical protein
MLFLGLAMAGIAVRIGAQEPTPTQTRLAASANPAAREQPLVLTAEVRPLRQADGRPAGTVVFLDANREIGSAPLAEVNGVATAVLENARLEPGGHALIARYVGASSFGRSESIPPLPVRVTER